MTYKEIINRFRTVVENHLQLKDFGYGDLSDLKTQSQLGPEEDGVDYPYLFLLPAPSVRQGPVMEYSFNMIVMDMARPEEGDLYDNYVTIQSQCQQYIDDVLAFLYHHYKDQPEITLTNITYTPFKEKYQDELAGMTATITIQVPTPLNDCITPIEKYGLIDERETRNVIDYNNLGNYNSTIVQYNQDELVYDRNYRIQVDVEIDQDVLLNLGESPYVYLYRGGAYHLGQWRPRYHEETYLALPFTDVVENGKVISFTHDFYLPNKWGPTNANIVAVSFGQPGDPRLFDVFSNATGTIKLYKLVS